MGVWDSGLYGNDTTCDVRDSYIAYIRDGMSDEDAYKKILDEYDECVCDEDEAPLFWLALADTQWKIGRLTDELKEKALALIEDNAGLDLWLESGNKGAGWKKTLVKLKEKLNSPMPKRKKLRKPIEFRTNIWEIGDVYAHRFTKYVWDTKPEQLELLGKYIVMQKIGNSEDCCGQLCSRIRFFDCVFDELPTLEDIKGVRILPVTPGPLKNYPLSFEEHLSCNMNFYRKKDYNEEEYFYLGNIHVPENEQYKEQWSNTTSSWLRIDDCFSCYYLEWQGFNYPDERKS